ncbi:BRCA1-associated RING domain protein 1 [Xyrichtys novacula]|uniref:BRCA1-associated RING domain protein 1 n=1 Tax=Xyrichtys novacula TaxID=13765 RepID=A0AAV1H1N0_XYRNO|nr:BRCA1-associated RING domain protein 1 [Xyrichtys novacula]
MDKETPVKTTDWKSTKQALANFRRLLICSKCSNLMKEPVCLGMCEHMLCRSCAGPRAGDGCAVCHSPAWVKDIQINRQLSSIVQLFCNLESLLGPTEQADSSTAEILPQPKSPESKRKKNFKIWFSPRSRKVRCTVEKPSEVSVPISRSSIEAGTAQPDSVTASDQDLSVFNFTSSSQDSGSGCSETGCKNENLNKKKRSTKKNTASRKVSVQVAPRITRKQAKQTMKKSRLEAINLQWGITEKGNALKEMEQPCSEGARRSSKRVSFLSPAVASEEPQPEVPKQSIEELSSNRGTEGASLSEGSAAVPSNQSQPCQSVQDRDKLPATATHPVSNPDKQESPCTPKYSSKRSRVEEKITTPETTPKRPRASPGRRRKSQMSPAVLNPPSSTSPRCERSIKKSPKLEQGDSPSHLPAAAGRKSPCAGAGRPSSGSPPFMKRNHKGETLLHLAAIKGDVEAVRELLDHGSDPNLKDNAGWTSLHEACNLGHLAVVEVLISSGGLLNTPGYENDSPLHDAVRNGHLAIVKLLLQHGASQNVLNLHGKRPADYAVSVEMQQIFQEASDGAQNANTALSPSASLSVVSDCARRDEMVMFLASKLSQPEQLQLAKLGGRIADTFSGSVSHVVVPEGPMPTTYFTLLGLLAGCWIVKFSCEYQERCRLVYFSVDTVFGRHVKQCHCSTQLPRLQQLWSLPQMNSVDTCCTFYITQTQEKCV